MANKEIFMSAIIDIYSEQPHEIKKFVDKFYENNINIENDLQYEASF